MLFFKLIRKILVSTLVPLKSLGLTFPKRLTRHLHYYGTVDVRVDTDKYFQIKSYGHVIENNLFWHGIRGHEPETLIPWLRAANTAGSILDIGANTGLFSLAAAAQNPKANIYSFEPLPRIANLLRKNVKLNPKFNVTVVERAISSQSGVARIYDPGGDQPGSASLRSDFLDSHTEPVEVNVDSIDSFCDEMAIGVIDLIKLDVEGVEESVLKGMRNTLIAYHPPIFMEMIDQRPELIGAISELIEIGYQVVALGKERALGESSTTQERNVLIATDPSQFVREGEYHSISLFPIQTNTENAAA